MSTGQPLPMFPLGTVLFPTRTLPLHVFEPRYRVLMHDCLRGDRRFGVVLIERGSEIGGGDARFAIGTVAAIERAAELPDGRWVLEAVGIERVHILEWLADDPYPRAMVEPWPDDLAGDDAARDRERVEQLLAELHAALARRAGVDAPGAVALDADSASASWHAAWLAGLGALDAQRVLELPHPAARFAALAEWLTDALAMLDNLA